MATIEQHNYSMGGNTEGGWGWGWECEEWDIYPDEPTLTHCQHIHHRYWCDAFGSICDDETGQYCKAFAQQVTN